jgi:hypothetical protein
MIIGISLTSLFNIIFELPKSETIDFTNDKDLDKTKEHIFSSFQIDLENFLELKYLLIKQLRIQPSEVEQLEYYELEYMIEFHKKWTDKEREAREKDEKQQSSITNNKQFSDAQKMMKNNNMPKMPSGSSMPKLPKF